MPIIENAEIHYARLNPDHPNTKFDKENPKWEVQYREADLDKVNALKDMGIKMRLIVYKEGHEREGEPQLNAEGKKQWRYTFRKGSVKAAQNGGGPADPPSLVDGDLNPVDPDIVGNGTIANLDVYQYDYDNGNKKASVLMGVQVTKLMYFKHTNQGFGKAAMQETQYPEPPEAAEGEAQAAAPTEASAAPPVEATASPETAPAPDVAPPETEPTPAPVVAPLTPATPENGAPAAPDVGY